jgi:hypothetical protein
MYKLSFKDKDGTERYRMIFEALMVQREPPQTNEWDTVVDTLKKFKSIGKREEQKTRTASGASFYLYTLDERSKRVLLLEKSEYKWILSCMKAPVWPSFILEEAREVVQWLEEQKYEEGSEAHDATPQNKRRAAKQKAEE